MLAGGLRKQFAALGHAPVAQIFQGRESGKGIFTEPRAVQIRKRLHTRWITTDIDMIHRRVGTAPQRAVSGTLQCNQRRAFKGNTPSVTVGESMSRG